MNNQSPVDEIAHEFVLPRHVPDFKQSLYQLLLDEVVGVEANDETDDDEVTNDLFYGVRNGLRRQQRQKLAELFGVERWVMSFNLNGLFEQSLKKDVERRIAHLTHQLEALEKEKTDE